MSSLNRATLIGYVGAAPEIRATQTGTRVASFSLATNENWTDRATGEARERTEWHRIVVFNEHLVGVVERFVDKGKQILVEGQLRTRKWTDNSGAERYTTEIVLGQFDSLIKLLGSNGGRDTQDVGTPDYGRTRPPAATPQQRGSGSARPAAGSRPAHDDFDDEIPF